MFTRQQRDDPAADRTTFIVQYETRLEGGQVSQACTPRLPKAELANISKTH